MPVNLKLFFFEGKKTLKKFCSVKNKHLLCGVEKTEYANISIK